MGGSIYFMIQRGKCSMCRSTYDSFSLAFSLRYYQEQNYINMDFSKRCINMSVNLENIIEALVGLVEIGKQKTRILETGQFLVREK